MDENISTNPSRRQHEQSRVKRALRIPLEILNLPVTVPHFYFRLVEQTLGNAQMSPEELDRLTGPYRSNDDDAAFAQVIVPQEMAAGFERMTCSWGEFIDGRVKDWKQMEGILAWVLW